MSKIQINQLGFGYTSSRNIFSGFNLELPQGAIIGLLGRNGEGKSTLMKLITGQLLARQGSVMTLGYDVKKRPVELLQNVYILPEEPKAPSISVRDYIQIISSFYPNYDASLADKLIREFDISWEMNLGKMSLGQRKKAMIALTLALRTSLLLMDEPTNGLDIPSKSLFRRLLAEHMSSEQTIIISTHQVRDLEQIIDHILLLEQGQMICNASIAELSAKYRFGRVSPESPRPLYSEASVAGEIGVWHRQPNEEEAEEADFSMELFFNAMVSKKL